MALLLSDPHARRATDQGHDSRRGVPANRKLRNAAKTLAVPVLVTLLTLWAAPAKLPPR